MGRCAFGARNRNPSRDRMTDSLLPRYEEPKQTLSWPRIAGTTFAIALHVVVFMTLMAPVTPAQKLGRYGVAIAAARCVNSFVFFE